MRMLSQPKLNEADENSAGLGSFCEPTNKSGQQLPPPYLMPTSSSKTQVRMSVIQHRICSLLSWVLTVVRSLHLLGPMLCCLHGMNRFWGVVQPRLQIWTAEVGLICVKHWMYGILITWIIKMYWILHLLTSTLDRKQVDQKASLNFCKSCLFFLSHWKIFVTLWMLYSTEWL